MLSDKNLMNFPVPSDNYQANDTWVDYQNQNLNFPGAPGSLQLDSVGTGNTNYINHDKQGNNNNDNNDQQGRGELDISLIAQRQRQQLAEAKRSVRGLDPRIPLTVNQIAKPRPYNGPKAEVVLAMRQQHLSQGQYHFYDKPLMLVEGQMQYVFNESGQAFLDLYSNVAHVGYSHPQHVRAISQAAGEILSNTRYLHPNIVEYTRRLKEKFPPHLSVVYLVNSGSEANDLAMRLARCHTKRVKMACLSGAYHGTTLSCSGVSTSISVGTDAGATDYGYAAQDTVVLPAADCYRGRFKGSDPEAADKYIQWSKEIIQNNCGEKNVAGFIVEAIQGVAGQIIYPKGYLAKMLEYVTSIGGVSIVDEVQTGFGRVGSHFWAFEAQGAKPDIVTLGKPMGNGFPLGAVLCTREISRSFDDTKYFNTFGGNPLSCAAGLAVLDILERDNMQAQALRVGVYFIRSLQDLQRKYSIIGDVRGAGTFIGVELVRDHKTLEPATEEAKHIMEELKKMGVLVGKGGIHNNVIRFKPPMCVTKENVDTAITLFDRVLTNLDRTFSEEKARHKGSAATGLFPRNSYVFPGSNDSITHIEEDIRHDDFDSRYSQQNKNNHNNTGRRTMTSHNDDKHSNDNNNRIFNFNHDTLDRPLVAQRQQPQQQNHYNASSSSTSGRPSLRDAVARSLDQSSGEFKTNTTSNIINSSSSSTTNTNTRTAEKFGYNWHSGNIHNPTNNNTRSSSADGFPSNAPSATSAVKKDFSNTKFSRRPDSAISTTTTSAPSLREAVRRSIGGSDNGGAMLSTVRGSHEHHHHRQNTTNGITSPSKSVSFALNRNANRRSREGEYDDIFRNSSNSSAFKLPN